MAQPRPFSGLRTYGFTLQRDMRELERYVRDLDTRIAKLVGNEGIGATISQQSGGSGTQVNLVKHASTHATKRGAKYGMDPIDEYEFDWEKAHIWIPDAATVIPITIRAHASQTANLFEIEDSGETAYFVVEPDFEVDITANAATKIPLTLIGATSQTAGLLRLDYDGAGTDFVDFVVESDGDLSLKPAGSEVFIYESTETANLRISVSSSGLTTFNASGSGTPSFYFPDPVKINEVLTVITTTTPQLNIFNTGTNGLTINAANSGIIFYNAAGTGSPVHRFIDPVQVFSTTSPQLYVGDNIGDYWTTSVDSSGNTTFALVGATPEFTFDDPVNFNQDVEFLDTLTITTTTTPQFIVQHTATSELVSLSVDGTGNATWDITTAGTPLFNYSDPVKISTTATPQLTIANGANTSSFTTDTSGRLLIDMSSSNNEVQIGNDASNYLSIQVGATGQVTFAAAGAADAFFFNDSTNILDTTFTPQFTHGYNASNRLKWSTLSTGATTLGIDASSTGTLTMEPQLILDTASPQLQIGPDLSNYIQVAVDADGDTDFSITGGGTRFNFQSAVQLHTHGDLWSSVVDGASNIAFSLEDQVSRTTGYAMRVINEADDIAIFSLGFDGKIRTGYEDISGGAVVPAAVFANTLMQFDWRSSLHATARAEVGMLGRIRQDTNQTMAKHIGLAADVNIDASIAMTNYTTKMMLGVVGFASCINDSANFSDRIAAGVYGATGSSRNTTTTLPQDLASARGPGDVDAMVGDWAHVTCFWAEDQWNSGSLATNKPAINSAFRGSIPYTTTGEVWLMYGDLPTPYSPTTSYWNIPTPSIAGGVRIPWPGVGTRRAHLYLIPGDLDDTTSTVLGDIVFDDGDGTTLEGLWENDGTAFRKLVPQSDHTATVSGSTATIGGIGSGPAGTAQVGWVEIKIDNGSAGGTTGWIPYWQ